MSSVKTDMEQEIQKTSNGETKPADDQDYKRVHDSSIDHKGNVPLRSSTGAWKASIFIICKAFIGISFSYDTNVRMLFWCFNSSLLASTWPQIGPFSRLLSNKR